MTQHSSTQHGTQPSFARDAIDASREGYAHLAAMVYADTWARWRASYEAAKACFARANTYARFAEAPLTRPPIPATRVRAHARGF